MALERCVARVGEPAVGTVMLLGVRVGGSPFFPTSYRWGYGWPYPKAYGALSEAEMKQVEERLSLLKKPSSPEIKDDADTEESALFLLSK